MKVKIGTRISPKLAELGIEKVVEWAAGAGLSILDVPQLDEATKVACDKAGMGIGTVDADWSAVTRLIGKDASRREEGALRLKEQIREIGRLGGGRLFMCLVPEDASVPRRETLAIWKETFPAIVRTAEEANVSIAIEGWPGPGPHYPAIGCTPEMWREMFRHIPSANLGLNYDPSHLVRIGIDYLRVLDEFGDRVVHCHGKDTAIMRDRLYECGWLGNSFDNNIIFSEGAWRYTIPGAGEVDWGRVAAGLQRLNYTGAVSIELEDHNYWGSLELEQQGIQLARAHLAEAFR